jgi:MSHA biogenesis protein MshL
MRTRVFKVNYLDIKRSGRSHMRVTSGQVTQAKGGGDGGAQTSAMGLQSQTFGRTPRETVASSRIETQTESDFWRELRASLEAIIGQQEGRSVVVTAHSGLVVVRALTSELRAVEEYLNSTQNVMQRQVILEAKILEVELNDGFQSGINWAAMVGNDKNRAVIGQTGGGRVFSGGTSSSAGDQGDLTPENPIFPGNPVTAFGGVFAMAINLSDDFAAFIELLKSQGDVQVLSSPRVSTVNNQKAVIKVGSDEFFVTDVQTNTNTSTATTTTQNNVELTPFFSGVALDVLPQISGEDDIILHVHPTVSRVQEQVKNIAVSTAESLAVPLAFSTTRESDSIVRAKNGQVVVIGGLMENIATDDRAGIPGLGEVPVIGALFRHQKKAMRKSELVILLRPIVVDNNQPWVDDLKNTREAFKTLSKATDKAAK